jgi:hypothetical protein
MSLLEEPETTTDAATAEPEAPQPKRDRPLTVADAEPVDADAVAEENELADDDVEHPHHPGGDEGPMYGPVQIDPSGRIPWRGMRIRRVRLLSVAKLSFIFWALAFGVLLGTTVVVWNVARAFGLIGEMETAVVSALGIDAFEIDGAALFRIVAAAVAFIAVLGWVLTIMLAAVYNASCAVFGGLAIETGPLQRRKRVFSLRHRGFVTIRS